MEIYDAIILNEQSREWSSAVEALRVPDYLSDLRVDELACRNLVSFADSLAAEARDRVFALIRKHLEAHATVISLLRQVLRWLEEDRRSSKLNAAQKSDLDFAEVYVREIARFSGLLESVRHCGGIKSHRRDGTIECTSNQRTESEKEYGESAATACTTDTEGRGPGPIRRRSMVRQKI